MNRSTRCGFVTCPEARSHTVAQRGVTGGKPSFLANHHFDSSVLASACWIVLAVREMIVGDGLLAAHTARGDTRFVDAVLDEKCFDLARECLRQGLLVLRIRVPRYEDLSA